MTNGKNFVVKKQSGHLRVSKSSFDLLKERHEKEMNDLYERLQELLEEFKTCHYFHEQREVQ
ncbi:hypothetical protein [Jeotgalibacillus campisalis]|uniref:Uncharacterized protein n=1 Tax=Jeotgalibacillus campisalis TaxID=220754 RepID=A0A0C2W506_9BACL|nr:hypothetical protein [Jeotgalibacillus campisalis]KIL51093.1 hypothetical protein KR50_09740 [Jeotgalibacillus campisalis]